MHYMAGQKCMYIINKYMECTEARGDVVQVEEYTSGLGGKSRNTTISSRLTPGPEDTAPTRRGGPRAGGFYPSLSQG